MTEVTPQPAVTTDSQEHIDAMVAKAEGRTPEQKPAGDPAQPTEPAKAERPAWLPEKFASVEDMAKAYAELEKKQGGGKADEKPAEATQDGDKAATDEAAQKAVESAGLDMDALGQKIVANGQLDEADYEALAKQGISRSMVDTYVEGQKALGERLVSRMHETVGGKDNFDNILSWAATALTPAEIEAFNGTVDTGSEAAVKLALEGLHAKWKAGGNQPPKLLSGTKTSASGDVFRSTAELTRAMNDPRYAKDPAYRAEVMARLDRSSIF